MGFMTPDPRDASAALALKLARALQARRWLARAPNFASWTKEFAQLCRQVAPALVGRVLDWYLANLDKPYLPRATTAETFRLKFERLEAAMNAQRSSAPVPITPESQRAAALLADAHKWPASVQPHLPALVQVSRDRIGRLTALLRRHQASLKDSSQEYRFITRVLELYLSIYTADCDWLPVMFQKYCRRGRYFGDPMALVFDWHGTDFRDYFWWEWALGWAGPLMIQYYDPLLEALRAQDSI